MKIEKKKLFFIQKEFQKAKKEIFVDARLPRLVEWYVHRELKIHGKQREKSSANIVIDLIPRRKILVMRKNTWWLWYHFLGKYRLSVYTHFARIILKARLLEISQLGLLWSVQSYSIFHKGDEICIAVHELFVEGIGRGKSFRTKVKENYRGRKARIANEIIRGVFFPFKSNTILDEMAAQKFKETVVTGGTKGRTMPTRCAGRASKRLLLPAP